MRKTNCLHLEFPLFNQQMEPYFAPVPSEGALVVEILYIDRIIHARAGFHCSGVACHVTSRAQLRVCVCVCGF